MKKRKTSIILTIVLVVVIAATVGAYHYFFVYRAPDNVSSREATETNEAYEYLMAASKSGLAAYDYVVVINPAHGGSDEGITVKLDDHKVSEADVVLAIAQYVKSLNTDSSIGIILTRDTDTNPTDEQRASFIEELKPDMVVDLHVSKDSDSGLMGVTSYYRSDYYRFDLTNETWADIVERNVATTVKTEALGLKDLVDQDADEYRYIKGVKVPAISLSCGYLSNYDEGQALRDSSYQQNIARGILAAIKEATENNRS